MPGQTLEIRNRIIYLDGKANKEPDNVQYRYLVHTKGMLPEDILNEVLGEFGVDINEKIPAAFRCNCSKERVEKALISIGRKELKEMIDEGNPIELKCHFCNTSYDFSVEELKKILRYAKG